MSKPTTQYDAMLAGIEEAAAMIPGVGELMGLAALRASGKCASSCPRDPATGECTYCAMMQAELSKGITLTYSDGSSETLRRS